MANARMIWWLIQQGTSYSLVESETPPKFEDKEGERRRKIVANYPNKETALSKGRAYAEQWHGTFKE